MENLEDMGSNEDLTGKSSRELSDEASKLLKQAGYDWSGRSKGDASYLQGKFEGRMVKCPYRGKSK